MPLERPAKDDIPGPSEAHRLNVDTETLALLEASQAQYGNLIRFSDPDRGTSVFINDGDLIQQVLVRNHKRYGKGRDFERVKMLLGNGIIVSDGDLWRRHRRMMQPAFSRTRIGDYVGSMNRSVERLRLRWIERVGETIDISKACSQFALEVILNAIFSDDLAGVNGDRTQNPFEFLSDEFARDLRAVTRLRRARDEVKNVIEERRRNEAERYDFLQDLIDAKDRDGVGLNEKEIVDEVMTLIVAGYETSAGTLNWAWYELARHPESAERLVQEFSAVCPGGKANGADDVLRLTQCRHLIAETLRLYPPVWLYSRRVTENDAFREAALAPGTQVYISPYLVHRNPEYWNDPEEFRPERFANEIAEAAFIPFSLGPRRCIGEHFAYLEMQLHLSTLLATFEPHLVDTAHPGLDLGINLRSNTAIQVRLERRE